MRGWVRIRPDVPVRLGVGVVARRLSDTNRPSRRARKLDERRDVEVMRPRSYGRRTSRVACELLQQGRGVGPVARELGQLRHRPRGERRAARNSMLGYGVMLAGGKTFRVQAGLSGAATEPRIRVRYRSVGERKAVRHP